MNMDSYGLIRIIRIALNFSIMAIAISYIFSVFTNRKWSLQLYRDVMIYHIVIIACSILSNQNTTLMPIVNYLCVLLFLFFFCGLRGMQLFKTFFICIAIFCINDFAAGFFSIYVLHFDAHELDLARHCISSICYIMNITWALLTLFTGYCCSVLSHPKENHRSERILRLFRPISLGVCLVILFLRSMQRTEGLAYSDRFQSVFPEFLVIILLLFLGGSYVLQDIKYLRQSRLNVALLYQKEAQEALLNETRVFRHNIANLLYGFQGILTSHDQTAIQDYYDNLVNTCAIVNNENVVALQRIPSLAVSSLLLNKIQSANEKKIPFYLFTDETLIYRGLKDKEMCEILGVLLDNALEGTVNSHAPLITVEFHNAQDDMEIIVRNTFDEQTASQMKDDIFFSITSSKEGHAGIGLSTVQKTIGNHERALFNVYMRGRFVEASLLIGG